MISKRVILEGDWKAAIDPELDRRDAGRDSNIRFLIKTLSWVFP